MNLNSQQLEAVKQGEGPILIVAGAGTGKTRVITERIVYLVKEKKVKPAEILALTFTEKAAQEMLERVDEAMPLGYEEIWISTFHSFCQRILQDDALEIGLDPGYRILSEVDQWLLIRKNLYKFDLNYYRPLSNPTQFIYALIKLFSRAKDDDITVEEYLYYAKKLEESVDKNDKAQVEEAEKIKELAYAYQTYQELMLKGGRLDFGDLQSFTLKLFRTRPSILKKYQKRFKYVLVDEYQDTNYAQNELIKLLVEGHKNITVTGDDDQAIYKFRGASISNILQFRGDFPQAKRVVLTQNYRSSQDILDSAYRLIKNNNPERLEVREGIDKRLISQAPDWAQGQDKQAREIKWTRFKTAEEESSFIAQEIKELVGSGDYSYRSFAVLARNNAHLDPVVSALRYYNLPYQLVGNRGLYDQEEIRDLICYLKVLNNFDDVSLFRVMNTPLLKISAADVMSILNRARASNLPLYKVWDNLGEEVSKKTKEKIKELQEMINKHLELMRRESVSQILQRFIEKTGYVKSLVEEESLENIRRVQNINLFFEKIREFESLTKEHSVLSFVEYLSLMLEAGDNPAQAEIEDIDLINLSTVHSAKGLEFPVVFMINLVQGRFPSYSRSERISLPDALVKERIPTGDIHLQEERRLFYVGMTRAKERLYLSNAAHYSDKKVWRTSPFVKEAIGEVEEESFYALPGVETFPLKKVREEAHPQIAPAKLKFSYTELRDYDNCPYLYKLKYIIKVPELPSAPLSFGNTIHLTMKSLYQRIMGGEKVCEDELIMSYESNWQNAGYESREHEERQRKAGEESLRTFYEKNKDNFGKPVFLEKSFKVKIDEYLLSGRIDRIDKLSDGDYELIDYKTGKVKKQKEIDKDDQLTLYALACWDVFKFFPKYLSFYFLLTNEKITTTRADKDLSKVKEKMLKLIEGIRRKEFGAKRNEVNCRYCSYRLICK